MLRYNSQNKLFENKIKLSCTYSKAFNFKKELLRVKKSKGICPKSSQI